MKTAHFAFWFLKVYSNKKVSQKAAKKLYLKKQSFCDPFLRVAKQSGPRMVRVVVVGGSRGTSLSRKTLRPKCLLNFGLIFSLQGGIHNNRAHSSLLLDFGSMNSFGVGPSVLEVFSLI